MSKFKVGDLVAATCPTNGPYVITHSGWIGIVVCVSGHSDIILVKGASHVELGAGHVGWEVDANHFELVKNTPTLEDKVDSLTKQVIALSKAIAKLLTKNVTG